MTNALIRQNCRTSIFEHYNIDTGCTTSIQLFCSRIKIPVSREIRQEDIISPKLVAVAFKDVFRSVDQSNKGIEIQGEKLNYLRFTDDIVLYTHDIQTAEEMLKELIDTSANAELHINRDKTQMMRNNHCAYETMRFEDSSIEFVDKYIYLDQQITHDHKIDNELLSRRSVT